MPFRPATSPGGNSSTQPGLGITSSIPSFLPENFIGFFRQDRIFQSRLGIPLALHGLRCIRYIHLPVCQYNCSSTSRRIPCLGTRGGNSVNSSIPSIFLFSFLSRCYDLHVHDGFYEWRQFWLIWFLRHKSYAVLLSLTALWDLFKSSAAYSIAQILIVCVQRKFHSVMLLARMDQCSRPCSEPPRSLARSTIVFYCDSRSATLFEDHINWHSCF